MKKHGLSGVRTQDLLHPKQESSHLTNRPRALFLQIHF